jgi:chaperonin cofactor prefoldin
MHRRPRTRPSRRCVVARSSRELVPSLDRRNQLLLVILRTDHAADHEKHPIYLASQELASLTEQNKVYKLVGPVLMKQEQSEAKHNVDKRLEWINDEM